MGSKKRKTAEPRYQVDPLEGLIGETPGSGGIYIVMPRSSEYEKIENRLNRIEQLIMGNYKRWMTLKEASQYSCLAEKTLKKLIEAGHIRARRLDNKWIVDRLSIDQFYEEDEAIIRELMGQLK